MERNIRFRYTPDKPDWVIDIRHESTLLIGVGNPFLDKDYLRILNEKLTFQEMCELEGKLEKPKPTNAKPTMMILEPDRVFVLKPSHEARQDTLGMILQQLLDNANARLIDNDAKGN